MTSKRGRWVLSVVAAALVVVAASFLLIRSGSDTPTEPTEGWVTAGTVEEIEKRYVVYDEEHELFVATYGPGTQEFIALSARHTAEDDRAERRRMLFCTFSGMFENEYGDVYDRTGHPLEGVSGSPMSQIPVRVRDGAVEVDPSRFIENDLDRFGGPHGPPCGEWGEVEEGPPGYALATEAPAGENQASIDPRRLRANERAKLHFAPGRQAAGLRWDLYRLDEEGLWQWRGILVAGPGYDSHFDIAPLEGDGIDDIGFGGRYSMDIEIPKLEPGSYRLATNSIGGRLRAPIHERYEWHYADFEVVAN